MRAVNAPIEFDLRNAAKHQYLTMPSRTIRFLKQVFTVPAPSHTRIGTSGLEPRIAGGDAFGDLEGLTPRIPDSWTKTWPGLAAFVAIHPTAAQPAKICIATDDIVGPTRNGGIGTTYAALADLLAGMGLDVTILYLKASEVENATLDRWIEHYATREISFLPIPNKAAIDGLETDGENCLSTSYNLLHFLIDHPMDVVHVSEWRGAGFLPLVCKRQGLALGTTTFVVKASSPWLWDRLYGMQPLSHAADLLQLHAERQSVELADVLVGGSTHLLRFMSSQGYRLPPRTYVQPNVLDMSSLDSVALVAEQRRGERVAVREFVFFGRLESRKGLGEFITSIKRMIRNGDLLPAAVTFLGKPGLPLAERPEMPVIDYIREETAAWPMPVNILTSMQQSDALQYLLSGPRLAVMPSKIENSSLVVYEAAVCGIPFLASNAGGNPELVDPRDRTEALVEPHPLPLADRLTSILRHGAIAARPSFSNDINLETWRSFHRHLPLDEPANVPSKKPTIAALIHAENVRSLDATLSDLANQDDPPVEVVIGLSDNSHGAMHDARETIARYAKLAASLVDTTDCGLGLSLNALSARANAEIVLCIEAGTRLAFHAVSTLSRVAASTGADFLTFFYRQSDRADAAGGGLLRANFAGSSGLSFFAKDTAFFPFAVKRERFVDDLAPATDASPGGIVQEVAGRATLLGFRCETIPLELASVPGGDSPRSHSATAPMIAARPFLASAPLALRDVLMRAQGLHAAESTKTPRRRPGQSPEKLRQPARANSLPPFPAPHRAQEARVYPGLARAIDTVRRSMHSLPMAASPLAPNSTSERQPHTGALLAARSSIIVGWVRNEVSPNTKVTIEARSGDNILDRVIADAGPETYAPPRHDLANHFFRLRIPKSFRAQKVSLWIAGADAPWQDIEAAGLGDTLENLGYQGWCDWTDPDRINGWIWQPAQPNRRVTVAVFVDGRFHVGVPAELHRHDLRDAGIGCGDYAFSIPVPELRTSENTRLFEVLVADTGVPLHRGRMLLADGQWRHSWRDLPKRLRLWQ